MRALVCLAMCLACSGKPAERNYVGSASASPPGADAARPVDAALATAPPDAAPASPEPSVSRVWTSRIADAATFEAYSKELGGERFAKFIVDLKSDAIYYFDVNVYPLHKDFIFAELYRKPSTPEATRLFERNHGVDKPDFVMGDLVHHLPQKQWTMALWDGDTPTSEHVRRTYKRMRDTFYLGDKVRFRPDSDYQEKIAKATRDVPHILSDQLYRLAAYAAFNTGSSVGTLRIVDPGDVAPVFAPNDIIVVRAPLADVAPPDPPAPGRSYGGRRVAPPVAGIISEAFSSPLSHLSLRARAWRIPNIGLREASKKLAAFDGTTVYFEARDATYVIRAATGAEIAAHAARAKRPPVVPPKADLTTSALMPLDRLVADDVHRVGAKAANLGVILAAKLPNVKVPPGFAIPYAHYDRHVKSAGIDKQIAAALADPAFKATDPGARRPRLEALRKLIAEAPLDGETCTRIVAALATLGNDVGVFVRSSHSAEDLAEFSGAGLYATLPDVRGGRAVCEAVREVWASVWNPAAYEARRAAGIDETLVYGGALVQVGVIAAATGVLVTQHPGDPDDERHYTIDAKRGLGADGRNAPESLIVGWESGTRIRVLARSDEDTRLVFDDRGVTEVPNTNQGKPVISNAMAIRLAQAAHRLTALFETKKLDIEWVVADDELHIVQARPLVP